MNVVIYFNKRGIAMPKLVQYTKGSIIYFEGDKDERIFILNKGAVALKSVSVETNETETEHVNSGEFFGVKSALGHFPREETAAAAADSTVLSFTVPEFETAFSTNKGVLMKMLRVFSRQLRDVHHRADTVMKTVSADRDALLLEIAQSFYDDEKYVASCDVYEKFFSLCADSPHRAEAERLYRDAKLRRDKMAERSARLAMTAVKEEVLSPETAVFQLPAFKRFAKQYKNDNVIICEGEPGNCFYMIQKGKVQLLKCVNGTNKNLDTLKSGELFGEMAILDSSPRSATCVAVGDTECLEFNKENFELLVMGNPRIAMVLLKSFCKRIYDQKRQLRTLAIKDPYARLADVFLMLDERNPAADGTKSNERTFDITKDDLAHWTGLSASEAHDEINKMVEKRKIDIYDKHIKVSDIADMKRIVDTRQSNAQ